MEAAGRDLKESRLNEVAGLAEEAGAQHLAAEIEAVAERLREGRFYVACVGQFKRGKSTLINALVEAPLLPTGVAPVTAIVTILRHGPEPSARVRTAQDGWRWIPVAALADYVTEAGNSENHKGVVAVEVFSPSPLLASGMCLVDTPGIGSVFAGNTEATRAFVPHVDAAVVVLGADPPVAADEIALVEEISGHCSDLVFVLNKADRLTDEHRGEALAFTRRILAERLGRDGAAIYEVSASEQLARQGPPRGWPALVMHLGRLARDSGAQLLRNAEERGLALVTARLRRHLDEELGALRRPLEESARRIEALRACVAEAQRSVTDLGYLFSAEQRRLGDLFSRQREEFLGLARPEARSELVSALRDCRARRGARLRAEAIGEAHRISRRWLECWAAEAQPAAQALYIEAVQRFVDLANGFLERLRRGGDPALESLPGALGPESGFRARSGLYYTSLVARTRRPPGGWLLDLVRSRPRQLRSLEVEIGGYLEDLLRANASRITADLDDRILESRRQLEAEIRSALAEVATVAERALSRARERHREGDQAVRARLQRLSVLRDRLDALRSAGASEALPDATSAKLL